MEENKNALVVPSRGTMATYQGTPKQTPPPQQGRQKPPEPPPVSPQQSDEETSTPRKKRAQKPANESPRPPMAEAESKSQENIDTEQSTEFITDKFSENLEKIGDILRTTVTAQNKAMKSDLDKVEKTYSSFISATKEQKSVLDKASAEQQEIFKNLTKQFIDFREDENADAKRFHDDLMATLQELHAAGGDKEAIATIEGMIRQGLQNSKIDPNRAKYDKKWELSAKDKEHWSYKMFGGNDERKSNISPEEVAIASGKAEALSKGIFSAEKPVAPQKTTMDKMLEAILKNTAGMSGNNGMPTKIEKLLVSKLVVDKLDERIDRKKKDKHDKVDHSKDEPKRQPDIEINPRPETDVRPKVSDVEDVAFKEVPVNRPKLPAPQNVVEAPKAKTGVVEHKQSTQHVDVRNVPSAKPVEQVRNLKTNLTPMAQAVRGAIKPTMAVPQPQKTMPQVVAGTGVAPQAAMASSVPAPAPDLSKPLAKEEVAPVAAAPAEESSGIGLSDIADLADLVPKKGLGKLLKGGGKMLGKIAAPLAAGVATYGGIKDEMNGKTVESLSDIIPEDTADKFNPFSYAMNAGRYVGDKINKGIGAVSKAVGGTGDLGSDIYDALHPAKPQAAAITPKVEAKPVSTPNVTKLTEEANAGKQAEVDTKQSASPTVIQQATPQQAAPQQVTNYVPVTGAPRTRENHFDRAVGKSFTRV